MEFLHKQLKYIISAGRAVDAYTNYTQQQYEDLAVAKFANLSTSTLTKLNVAQLLYQLRVTAKTLYETFCENQAAAGQFELQNPSPVAGYSQSSFNHQNVQNLAYLPFSTNMDSMMYTPSPSLSSLAYTPSPTYPGSLDNWLYNSPPLACMHHGVYTPSPTYPGNLDNMAYTLSPASASPDNMFYNPSPAYSGSLDNMAYTSSQSSASPEKMVYNASPPSVNLDNLAYNPSPEGSESDVYVEDNETVIKQEPCDRLPEVKLEFPLIEIESSDDEDFTPPPRKCPKPTPQVSNICNPGPSTSSATTDYSNWPSCLYQQLPATAPVFNDPLLTYSDMDSPNSPSPPSPQSLSYSRAFL